MRRLKSFGGLLLFETPGICLLILVGATVAASRAFQRSDFIIIIIINDSIYPAVSKASRDR